MGKCLARVGRHPGSRPRTSAKLFLAPLALVGATTPTTTAGSPIITTRAAAGSIPAAAVLLWRAADQQRNGVFPSGDFDGFHLGTIKFLRVVITTGTFVTAAATW